MSDVNNLFNITGVAATGGQAEEASRADYLQETPQETWF